MSANSKPKAAKAKPTIGAWLKLATSQLRSAGVSTARLDAEIILADHLSRNRTWLIAHSDDRLETSPQLDQALKRRLEREPLAYLRGYKEFYGRDFIVTTDVLIPRPESETIINLVKQIKPKPNLIIDVGTGSGALAITIALELAPVTVVATDISPEALIIAKQNAHHLKADINFTESHLLDNIADLRPDVIVANLPYVDAKWKISPEAYYEPALALFATDQGLGLIKECIDQASRQLVKKGYLVLEADPIQHSNIVSYATGHSLTVTTIQDYIIVLRRD